MPVRDASVRSPRQAQSPDSSNDSDDLLDRGFENRALEESAEFLSKPQKIGIGERGIRTLGRVSPTHAFQACSFNHSDISPHEWNQQLSGRRGPAQQQTVT